MASLVAEIVASTTSVSDKIRALDAAGYPRAEIARLLGKRYQHVRNVLEYTPKQKAAAAPPAIGGASAREISRTPSSIGGVFRLEMSPDGVVQIPGELMEALNLGGGGVLVAKVSGDDLILTNAKVSARRVQDRFRTGARAGVGLVDELIADRRREAASESQEH